VKRGVVLASWLEKLRYLMFPVASTVACGASLSSLSICQVLLDGVSAIKRREELTVYLCARKWMM